jgi:acetyl-CoA acetyltransferase/uncharacterized OB-fold protein
MDSGEDRPEPLITFSTQFYWTSGADGVLRLQRCDRCRRFVHPPGPVCPDCRSRDLSIEAVSGEARVASFTINHQQWGLGLPLPYIVAIVTLEDDTRVRLTTSIIDCDIDAVIVGMPVTVRFIRSGRAWIPVFAPRDDAAHGHQDIPDLIQAGQIGRSVRPLLANEKYEDKVAISGVGMSRIGRRLMVEPIDLTVEACLAAITDAGLEPSDIDGLSTYPGTPKSATEGLFIGLSEGGVSALEQALSLRPTWHNGASQSGGAVGSLGNAMLAVAAGLCRHVLCFRTVWEATRAELVKAGTIEVPSLAAVDVDAFLLPYGCTGLNTIAMAAAEHFRRYGTTRETLGAIAVNARANAALNPTAVFRKPLSMDDYFGGRMLSTPLSFFDVDPLTDGAVAVIVSAADAAAELPRPLIKVEAVGTQIIEPIAYDQGILTHVPGVFGPAAHMWSRTTLTPADVDVAEIYDGTSFNCLSWLEALGFCGVGEAKDFLDGGYNIARDGLLPLNTHGGQLSHGRTHGMGMIHEAVTQLRGEAGERQVRGARVAAVCTGAVTPAASMLLRRE